MTQRGNQQWWMRKGLLSAGVAAEKTFVNLYVQQSLQYFFSPSFPSQKKSNHCYLELHTELVRNHCGTAALHSVAFRRLLWVPPPCCSSLPAWHHRDHHWGHAERLSEVSRSELYTLSHPISWVNCNYNNKGDSTFLPSRLLLWSCQLLPEKTWLPSETGQHPLRSQKIKEQ